MILFHLFPKITRDVYIVVYRWNRVLKKAWKNVDGLNAMHAYTTAETIFV